MSTVLLYDPKYIYHEYEVYEQEPELKQLQHVIVWQFSTFYFYILNQQLFAPMWAEK